MEFVQGGVCAAKGFKAAATAAKIKYEGRNDMAAIVSDLPCSYAGVFTKNVVKAAPVKWDMQVLDGKKKVHAIIANSGIANAATGPDGMEACYETAEYAANKLGFDTKEVLVASTGVIGFSMPMDRVKNGIDSLSGILEESHEAADLAAKAIMTTDTHDKQIAVKINIGGVDVTVGCMAKGSGMIHPNMCTMLSFITTDAAIEQKMLQKALSEIVKDTFNMVSVDGDTSTNDSCLVLANGAAKNPIIDTYGADFDTFKEALFSVCKEISMMLAGDGEGATALVESVVTNVSTKEKARALAKSVITSSLTKAAIFGHDANWGRIMCALGYAGVDFDPNKIDIFVESENGRIQLVGKGVALDYSEEVATKVLSGTKVTIISDIKTGEESAVAWGCDLTYDYVKINADYRS